MKLEDILALAVGDKVGFKPSPDSPVIPCTVLHNGPRLIQLTPDPRNEGKPIITEGEPIPHMNDLLIIQLENSPATVSWEPVSYPNGIRELIGEGGPDPEPEPPEPPERPEPEPQSGPPPMRPLPNPPKIPPPAKSVVL